MSFDFTSIPGTDNGIIITGAGGNTELIQNADTNTFSLTGLHGGRVVRFENLRMSNTNNAVIPPDPATPMDRPRRSMYRIVRTLRASESISTRVCNPSLSTISQNNAVCTIARFITTTRPLPR